MGMIPTAVLVAMATMGTSGPRDPQIDAARALIGRVVGSTRAASFDLALLTDGDGGSGNGGGGGGGDGGDGGVTGGVRDDGSHDRIDSPSFPAFEISTPGPGRVALSGTSGVALASAFHWYLKYGCNASIM